MFAVSFVGLDKLQVLWLYSETKAGGFHFDPHTIGMFLGFPSLFVIFLQHLGLGDCIRDKLYIAL